MPFTGSHPAAVLPFVGTTLPAAALVIGAMAPDLPYYLPVSTGGVETHSWVGVVTVDLALGLLCFAVWYLLAVPPLLAAASESVRARIPVSALHPLTTSGQQLSSAPAARVLLGVVAVAVGTVIGAATHVLWDSFTHENRWGVSLIPWLGEVHGGKPGWQWAQWASGVVGAALIVWWLVRWWRRTPPTPPDGLPKRLPPTVVAITVGAVVVVGAAAAWSAGFGRWQTGSAFDNVLFVAFTRGAGAAAVAALAVMVLWHVVGRRA